MLKYKFKFKRTQKFGNVPEENEDSILHPSEVSDDVLVKFAVSDGATESSFSAEWSDLLVSMYDERRFGINHLPVSLTEIAETWASKIDTSALPWYAEQKAQTGAFATFLGVTIDLEKHEYRAVAIGDSVMFIVRNNNIFTTFPIKESKEFRNTPDLFATNPRYQAKLENTVVYDNNTLLAKDLIIIATDALAAWMFQEIEAGRKPWAKMRKVVEHDDLMFDNWLNTMRKVSKIKNDDVTLLLIYLK